VLNKKSKGACTKYFKIIENKIGFSNRFKTKKKKKEKHPCLAIKRNNWM